LLQDSPSSFLAAACWLLLSGCCFWLLVAWLLSFHFDSGGCRAGVSVPAPHHCFLPATLCSLTSTTTLSPGSVSTMSAAPLAASVAPWTVGGGREVRRKGGGARGQGMITQLQGVGAAQPLWPELKICKNKESYFHLQCRHQPS